MHIAYFRAARSFCNLFACLSKIFTDDCCGEFAAGDVVDALASGYIVRFRLRILVASSFRDWLFNCRKLRWHRGSIVPKLADIVQDEATTAKP